MATHDYEVFLSFRGPDTRSQFTDYLHMSLTKAGIRVYEDDNDIHVREEIGPGILQAIKRSKISIPIFSKGYASSERCLMELVQMAKCKNETGQKIMPIFYDVAPAEVRHQSNDYGKALVTHAQKKRYNDETIEKWKCALKQVTSLRGWDLASKPNRYLFGVLNMFVQAKLCSTQPNMLIFAPNSIRREGEFAKEVTRIVLTELKKIYSEV